jgi:hypothetical protein
MAPLGTVTTATRGRLPVRALQSPSSRSILGPRNIERQHRQVEQLRRVVLVPEPIPEARLASLSIIMAEVRMGHYHLRDGTEDI